MGGSRNLVIFLGIALVIVRFLTSSQRSALAGLWNVGAPKKTKPPLMQGAPGTYATARGGR